MEIVLSTNALADLGFWKKSGNKAVEKRINALLQAIAEDPFEVIGKPEPLKENWSGFWSRRITEGHRIIYKIAEGQIIVAQLRHHY